MTNIRVAIRSLLCLFLARRCGALLGFDSRYYLEQNEDVRRARIDPFQHFIKHGWREHRNPSKGFSIVDYLDANPDVRQAGVNPLLHYIEHGIVEGRLLRRNVGATNDTMSSSPVFSAIDKTDLAVVDRIQSFHRAGPATRGRLV